MAIREPELIKHAVLNCVADGQEYPRKKIIDMVADCLSLTNEERSRRVPSGNKTFENECIRPMDELVDADLLKRPRRGYYKIAPEGLEFLRQNPEPPVEPDPADDGVGSTSRESETIDDPNSPNAEEYIEKCYQQIRSELAAELLQQIKEKSPRFFEELVIDLLVQMGYGGSREDAEAVGRSHDGGIDGIINEDRLGLDVVYVQAKRWREGKVGQPEIFRFSGALRDRGARKGIFITTSSFTTQAKDSADNSDDPKIVLIDGRQLADYMIDHNVGLSTVKTYEIKRVDSDYFIETEDSQTQES